MAYYHSNYNTIRKKKKSGFSKIIFIILFILFLAAIGIAYQLWVVILKSNTWVPDNESTSLFIETGSNYDDLKTQLYSNGVIINRKTFEWLSNRKNLASHIYPGHYTISAGMNNNDLINLFRSGEQTPVNLIFHNIRTTNELGRSIGAQLEVDSANIVSLLTDSIITKKFGLYPETVICMFIPNTYEVYWNVTSDDLLTRMYAEYQTFWTRSRLEKAEQLGFSREEIITLASIVEKESTKNDEKSKIAGVYLNRLKYGWRLQADPTIVYAWGDFSIRRVLNLQKQIDSPYNTYKYYGLPPGPICMPSIASIDAVLNSEEHAYMYFCAKDDFSGYHVFATTNAQHSINANKYRNALDELNIRK